MPDLNLKIWAYPLPLGFGGRAHFSPLNLWRGEFLRGEVRRKRIRAGGFRRLRGELVRIYGSAPLWVPADTLS